MIFKDLKDFRTNIQQLKYPIQLSPVCSVDYPDVAVEFLKLILVNSKTKFLSPNIPNLTGEITLERMCIYVIWVNLSFNNQLLLGPKRDYSYIYILRVV